MDNESFNEVACTATQEDYDHDLFFCALDDMIQETQENLYFSEAFIVGEEEDGMDNTPGPPANGVDIVERKLSDIDRDERHTCEIRHQNMPRKEKMSPSRPSARMSSVPCGISTNGDGQQSQQRRMAMRRSSEPLFSVEFGNYDSLHKKPSAREPSTSTLASHDASTITATSKVEDSTSSTSQAPSEMSGEKDHVKKVTRRSRLDPSMARELKEAIARAKRLSKQSDYDPTTTSAQYQRAHLTPSFLESVAKGPNQQPSVDSNVCAPFMTFGDSATTQSFSLGASMDVDDKTVMSRLQSLMQRTQLSQKRLQEWDKQNGLPASHSSTMVNTSRSRRQLQEGVILKKRDGTPLVDNVGEECNSRGTADAKVEASHGKRKSDVSVGNVTMQKKRRSSASGNANCASQSVLPFMWSTEMSSSTSSMLRRAMGL